MYATPVTARGLFAALMLEVALVCAACGRSGFDDPVVFVGTGGGVGGACPNGGNPTAALIPCGTLSCDPASQLCCASTTSTGPAPTCIAAVPGVCGVNYYALACRDSSSCTCGTVCCLAPSKTSCVPAASCASPNGIACRTSQDCPAARPYCCGGAVIGTCTTGPCVP